MARTQEQIEAEIDALKAAMARGVRKLRMNGEEVEYASMQEMRMVLNDLQGEMAALNGGTSRAAMVPLYPTTSRGL